MSMCNADAMQIMYDKTSGKLRPGYHTERSYPHNLVDVATSNVIVTRLRTPSEAADLNSHIRATSHRWVPVS